VGQVNYDVVKIATDGRAVSFLDYEDFDGNPHPPLLRSLRVFLPRASFGIRDYRGSDNPPILHRKDAFVGAHYPLFAKFRQLTEQEEALGLLSQPDIGFSASWQSILDARGLTIVDHQVVSLR